MKITLHPYNPQWATNYVLEKIALEKALIGSDAQIEHIGSTAIEGLLAKPVLDILIGFPNFEESNKYITAIQDLGYEYMAIYEDIMPYRRFFLKEENGERSHHIHLVALNSPFWTRHLAFRNYLRRFPKVRAEYAQLKEHLAQQEWANGSDYSEAKTYFIRSVERLALETVLRPLKSSAAEWLDFDMISHEVSKLLGIAALEAGSFTENKWVYWTNNATGNTLHQIVLQLQELGILEKEEETDMFRWNKDWLLKE